MCPGTELMCPRKKEMCPEKKEKGERPIYGQIEGIWK